MNEQKRRELNNRLARWLSVLFCSNGLIPSSFPFLLFTFASLLHSCHCSMWVVFCFYSPYKHIISYLLLPCFLCLIVPWVSMGSIWCPFPLVGQLHVLACLSMSVGEDICLSRSLSPLFIPNKIEWGDTWCPVHFALWSVKMKPDITKN